MHTHTRPRIMMHEIMGSRMKLMHLSNPQGPSVLPECMEKVREGRPFD